MTTYQGIQHAEEDVRVQVLLKPSVAYAKHLTWIIRTFMKRSKAAKRPEYVTLVDFLDDYADLLESTKEFNGPERVAYVLSNGRRV